MRRKCLAALAALVAFAALTVALTLAPPPPPPPAAAQSGERMMPTMRTPDGQPDVSGAFTYRTLTPFQRPARFRGRERLGAEEAAAFEAAERKRLNRDLIDRPRSEWGVLSYNEFWFERGAELTYDRRTSLIVDPPGGRLPPLTAAAVQARAARGAYQREHRYDSYENRSLVDRCIMASNSGPPMRPGAYNDNVMIFQTPGYVAILNEMVHNARVIPIGGDTAKPPFPQFAGVSRAHWEGETLVIETTQFRGGRSGVAGPNMHLIERLARIDPDTVAYEYTVTDPTVYTAPYTVRMPLRRTDGPLFEYACHEGNHALYGILAGARRLENLGRELRP